MESLEMPFPANPTFQPPQEMKVLEYLFFCNIYIFVTNEIHYITISFPRNLNVTGGVNPAGYPPTPRPRAEHTNIP